MTYRYCCLEGAADLPTSSGAGRPDGKFESSSPRNISVAMFVSNYRCKPRRGSKIVPVERDEDKAQAQALTSTAMAAYRNSGQSAARKLGRISSSRARLVIHIIEALRKLSSDSSPSNKSEATRPSVG
jgi:hypothetical protein